MTHESKNQSNMASSHTKLKEMVWTKTKCTSFCTFPLTGNQQTCLLCAVGFFSTYKANIAKKS